MDTSSSGRQQTIDGFGTCLSGTEAQSDWWRALYFDDLGASVLRFDLVPRFGAAYSDFTYNSPWFHNSPALPGPDGNNVRTYTDAASYRAQWSGRSAPIAVMGPDIDQNVALFDFDDDVPKTAGLLAQLGDQKKAELGDFKLIASLWSPAPWLKISSGNTIGGQSGILPVNGTPWPFIWGGNFSGGMLDVSGTPRAEFDDSSVGGTGPTSALVQFSRGLAAYLRGFQQRFGVKLHAISIQNELNFETFYNSCTYPLSSQYITALKAARAELDRHDDLRGIQIMGPEDLLGGDGWGMWQYGGGNDVTHKNLQYLANLASDPEAAAAVSFFNIHGYAPDGVSSAGANATQWDWWVNGWSSSPAQGLPAQVQGFASYGKKSWMTETSGESTAWLAPASGYPSNGAFSIAVKIHQALTTGRESAWVYWQMTDGSATGDQTLTDATARDGSPKYVAAKHFFKYVRPGAVRAATSVTDGNGVVASAYVHDANGTLTVVLINVTADPVTATVDVPPSPENVSSFDAHTSSDGNLWQPSTVSVSGSQVTVPVPGYGVVTLVGQGAAVIPPPGTGGATGGGGAAGGGTTGGGGSPAGGTAGGGAAGGGGGTAGNGGGPGGTGGAPGSSGGAGATGGAGPGPDGGAAPAAAAAGDDGGCGCRAAPRAPSGAAWTIALALAALRRRRLRPRRRAR